MSELTYKKIVDVEQIETLNNAATVFINDDGAMKQVAANKFGLGTVKTVNGIEPDENGNIKSDIAVPVLITHLKFPMFDDIKCNKTYEELHHSFLTQSTEATSIALCLYTALDKSEEYRYCTNFVLEKDNGEFTKRYFLYFGEDIAPYIIDVEANTITLDPNWVASTACVKTVNGVAPDEDGDLTIVEPQTFVFTNIDGDVDCPYEVSELIKFATDASAYKSVRFVHRVRDLFDPSVPIRDYVWTGASIPATGTGVFKINFGDEIAPILINSNTNTITLDPDWVAPTACVKTVNGIEPDENGDIKSDYAASVQFRDMSFMGMGLQCNKTASEINLYTGRAEAVEQYEMVDMGTYPQTPIYRATHISKEGVYDADGATLLGWKIIIYFGNLYAPVIVNTATNTITLDSDWVAPEANITESAANTLVDTKVAELATTVDTKLAELAAQELSLPKSAGVVDHGTAGQFAVSDGMGGIMWKTLVEVEEVSY